MARLVRTGAPGTMNHKIMIVVSEDDVRKLESILTAAGAPGDIPLHAYVERIIHRYANTDGFKRNPDPGYQALNKPAETARPGIAAPKAPQNGVQIRPQRR